jgi:hypothetical protein
MNKNRNSLFKVTPINIVTGTKAPYYVMEYSANANINLKKEAEKEARSLSRLSSFKNWNFEVEKI